MEEWVGAKWHHFITQKSRFYYPRAVVKFEGLSKQLAIFFRTLGGDPGIGLSHTSASANNSHRNWLQKISGTGKKSEAVHFSGDYLYLPETLGCFNSQELNQDLYFWLTAMASFNCSPKPQQVIEHNQLLTQQVLQQWPGLKAVYQRLVKAHLKQRPNLKSLPDNVKKAEYWIQQVLQKPTAVHAIKYDHKNMPQPVVMWLRPVTDKIITKAQQKLAGSPPKSDSDAAQQSNKTKRYQAENVDCSADKNGFMSFRLESLFSWSEFINVDRSEDDGDDEDVFRVADDLDHLSINEGETGHKIRLDLDLPSSEYDDVLLSEGILLPEWDYKKQQLVDGYCSLQLMALRPAESSQWPNDLQVQANRLKRQFEGLKPISKWHNHQADGDEIDLDAYLHYSTARSLKRQSGDALLYRSKVHQNRDLSTLILTDLSLSTDAHVNDEKKVIDVIKEALYLLSSSLEAAGERFSIAGFTSKNRNCVRYYDIKGFNAPFDQACQDQIHAMKPAYYTRMGAAIRYATGKLKAQSSQQKLLLILTDGKPNDLDKYESRYGLEDTKKAVQEAKNQGLTPFCVSIDYQASDYLPYLFGSMGFVHLNNALELPKKLPKLFFQLIN